MSGKGLGHSYIWRPSDPLMCVPATINLVFTRRGIGGVPDEEIARLLGLIVPPDRTTKYPFASVSADETKWGVHPQVQETSIQRLLETLGLPVFFAYLRRTEIPTHSILEFLRDNLDNGNDIVVGHDYRELYGKGSNVGHVSIVQSAELDTEDVVILEPFSGDNLVLTSEHLVRGIDKVQDGFWLFADRESNILRKYST